MLTRMISGVGKRRPHGRGWAIIAVLALAALVAVAGLAAASGRAQAASKAAGMQSASTSTFVGTFKGNGAFADWNSVNGCIFTEAFVGASEQMTRPDNTSGQFLSVSLTKFDTCTQTLLVSAGNKGDQTLNGTMQFGKGLSTAAVNGTVNMIDFLTNTPFTVTVDLTWQGFGDTTRQIDSFHVHGPGFLFSSHFNGLSRAAEASGTLSDGTTNWAPDPTLFAELDDVSAGSVNISHL